MMNLAKMPSHADYFSATPFPHAVVNGAFDNKLLETVESELAAITHWNGQSAHQFAQRKRWCSRPEFMGEKTRVLLDYLQGPTFLPILETITGISGLIPDPYLEGGGIHSISRGGYLGVHADFNFHPRLQLHRRINLILYLNHGWQREWGGALELWSTTTRRCEREIFPEINTMVIFNTTDTSLHGHPRPLECPEERLRSSIALYYYSAVRPDHELSAPHSTNYYRV
jgi:hypothetical protein